jgi:uncharacterized protein YecT (DUF1311 family)
MTLAIRFLPNPGRKFMMVPADGPIRARARQSTFHFPTPKQSSPTRRPDWRLSAQPPIGRSISPAASTGRRGKCTTGKTNVAGQRLNAAYKALQARIDTAQRQPLLAAQRLWVQYRDANCGFYGVQDGSIRQVQAARKCTLDDGRPGA